MPEISVNLPEKLQCLFQDHVLDEFGQKIPELDPDGNQLYHVDARGVATQEPRYVQIRNIYIRGGRGGAKSMSMGQFVALDMLTNGHQWLLAREIQDSIKDSSYKEVRDGAVMLGIEDHFRFNNDKIVCVDNGAECLFSGLRYVSDSVKSKKGIMRVWIEEADKVSEKSIDTLTPTIRAPGSRLYWTYNPNHNNDPVHLRALSPGPRDLSIVINWRDNPWFPPVLLYEKDELRRTNFRKYLKVYEGMTEEQSGSTTFDPKWFLQRWKNLSSIRGNCYILFDPANTDSKKSDFTAWAVWIMGYDKNKYLIELGRDRLVGVEKWDKLVEIHRRCKKRYESVTVGYERYGAQSDISFFRTRMEEVGYRFPIKELAGKMSKTDRISLLSNPMSVGIVYLPTECPNKRKDGVIEDMVKVLTDELSMHPFIPKDVHDDVSDVAARIEDPVFNAVFPEGEASEYEEDQWGRPAKILTDVNRDWEI